jgi:hypothetical protein
MLDVAASDGISIAASEDACTWPARRSTLQRIRGAQRALMAPSCEGQTFPRLPASLVPGESATACQPRNAQHTTCSLWEWHHLRLPCVQHLDTTVSGLVVRLHSALTQRHTTSGALRHRLLQHIATPPRFARFPSPSSATNCAVRDAKQRDDAPMADHHVQWSRSIFDGLSRQSADAEQTRHQIAAATVTFQAQRSTMTTCVAGDPPLRDNRLLTCTCSSLHRASRAVVSAGAGPEADIVLLEHRHLCAYWAPCQPTALNLVTQASDIHLYSSQAHRVLELWTHPLYNTCEPHAIT